MTCTRPLHTAVLAVLAAGATALGLAAPASAQPMAGDASASQLTLGLGAVYAPSYEGSDEHKTRALPLINYRSGRFFAGTLGGIGYNLSSRPEFEFGPLLSYRFGRDESDAVRLRGLGDIDPSADLGVFVRWNLRPAFLHATVKQGLGGQAKGAHVRFGAGYRMVLSPSDLLLLDASAEWADKRVMQAFFGVDPIQATRSGLPAYAAGAGIRRYGLGAMWTRGFTPQWFSSVGLGVYRLGQQAADSPITVDRQAMAVSAGISYRF